MESKQRSQEQERQTARDGRSQAYVRVPKRVNPHAPEAARRSFKPRNFKHLPWRSGKLGTRSPARSPAFALTHSRPLTHAHDTYAHAAAPPARLQPLAVLPDALEALLLARVLLALVRARRRVAISRHAPKCAHRLGRHDAKLQLAKRGRLPAATRLGPRRAISRELDALLTKVALRYHIVQPDQIRGKESLLRLTSSLPVGAYAVDTDADGLRKHSRATG
eukprot:6194545-Pleurochrysis_carterae.AAC.6